MRMGRYLQLARLPCSDVYIWQAHLVSGLSMSPHLALYFHHAAFQDVKAPELWERIQATGSHAWYSKAVEYWDRYVYRVPLQVAPTAMSHRLVIEGGRAVVQQLPLA